MLRGSTDLTETGDAYVAAALAEIDLAGAVLGAAAPPVSTVFVGGGTPTLLAAADLVRLLRRIETTFGLADGAEVTTEANPESVSPASLSALRAGGLHPDLVRDAVGRTARARHPGSGALAGPRP